jgi:hypothetical protein
MNNSEFHLGPNAFSDEDEWTERGPQSVLWVEAFVVHWFEVLRGPGEVDDVVDRAFELYVARGEEPAAEAAAVEFDAVRRRTARVRAAGSTDSHDPNE